MNKKFFCTAFIFIFMLIPRLAYAEKEAAKAVPTNIKADRMEYNSDRQTVIFYNNVHVIRPDFNMWAKKMTVYLEKTEKSPDDNGELGSMRAGDISIIVAEGDVVMKSQGKESHSKKATYTIKTDTLKLEGPPNPWLKDKDNTISGQTILHYMKDDRSEVRGGVSASFTTLDKGPQKKQE